MFLLNKNIQQLLDFIGHPTRHLRQTLSNLMLFWSLIENNHSLGNTFQLFNLEEETQEKDEKESEKGTEPISETEPILNIQLPFNNSKDPLSSSSPRKSFSREPQALEKSFLSEEVVFKLERWGLSDPPFFQESSYD